MKGQQLTAELVAQAWDLLFTELVHMYLAPQRNNLDLHY